jgi:hypothetical protein
MSEPIRAVLWTGGDAPNKDAKISSLPTYEGFAAYWEPGYCGCPDCSWIVRNGLTEEAAIADYWRQWEEKYED